VHDPDPPPGEGAPPSGWEGRVLAGRFHVEKLLGQGGMGEVLLARDQLLDRRVALKHVRADAAHGGDQAKAILQEARRASRINDRHVAAVHDVVTDGDDVLIVMEFVQGETLRARLHQPMPMEQFWDLAEQCLSGLGAAHAHGVIHRDIKPENLMVTHGREVKILDFGIARRSAGVGTSPALTTTGELFKGAAGTPPYMAPEAHYGGRVDERTDLFSLGTVFYEMLTAQHPFTGGSYEVVVDKIMKTPPRPASELNPAVSPQLSGVVAKMLARDPDQRFASCADVAAALQSARRGTGERFTQAATAAIPAPSRPPRPLNQLYVMAGVLALVAAAIQAWRMFASPPLPVERRLVLLPPTTSSADPDFKAFAVGATEALARRLAQHQLTKGFQLSGIDETYLEKLVTPQDARQHLGANLVLIPSFDQRENRITARLELREPKRGRLMSARNIDVPVQQPFAFADSVYHAALTLVHLPMRTQTAQTDLGIQGAGTLRFLLQGIGRRRTAETVEAKQRALADFETAYRTEPEPSAPRCWLSLAQLTMFNATQDTTWLVRAEASAREAVSLDSARSENYRSLGAILSARKSYADAEVAYRTVSQLDPTDDEAWYRWGRTLVRMGKANEERAVYEAAIARRPHCVKPWWWLATWEYRNGHTAEACVAYREMIRRSPDWFNGYSSLAGMLLLNGRYSDAIDSLRIAIELRPAYAAYSNLGTAYFNSGHAAEAVAAYNQAFQFGEVTYTVWLNLGDAYYWLSRRPDRARDAYRQAVRVARAEMAERDHTGGRPDPLTAAALATIYPKLGEPDSARAMMARALALDSLNTYVQYDVALAQWELGDRRSAIEWLTRSVASGFPVAWVRDSPVHRDWRGEPGFDALLASAAPAVNDRSPGKGATR
jgi:tetratricopeptide (TPR) repeat protein/TolB-like protein